MKDKSSRSKNSRSLRSLLKKDHSRGYNSNNRYVDVNGSATTAIINITTNNNTNNNKNSNNDTHNITPSNINPINPANPQQPYIQRPHQS